MKDVRIGRCIDCGNLFITDIFHIKIQKYCDECRRIHKNDYGRVWYSRNKKRCVEYRLKNRGKIVERKVGWYKSNNQKISKQKAEYYKLNNQKIIN